MVDVGSRAASVTIQRVMDTEHALSIVTIEIMLNTLLNHWIKYYGNQTVPEPIQKELFEIRGFDVVLLPRVSVFTLILVTRPGKQECLGKHWIPSCRRCQLDRNVSLSKRKTRNSIHDNCIL